MRTVKNGVLLFLLIFSFLFTACAPAVQEYVPELVRPASARVDTVRVDRGTVAELYKHMGITRYMSEPVYFDNPVGPFGSFYVSPGEWVTEGQILASLDIERLEEQIEERVQRLATMRSNNALANERRLIAIDIMVAENAKRMLDAAENFDVTAGEAAENQILAIEWAQMELRLERERQSLALRHEEERLQSLRDRLQYTELFAPFDGVVTFVNDISPGQQLGVAQPLMYISDTSKTIVELVGLTGQDFPSTGGIPGWRPLVVRDAVMTHAHIGERVYELEFIVTALEDRHFRPAQFTLDSGYVLPVGKLFPVYFYTTKVEDVIRVPINAVFSAQGSFFVHKMVNGELVHTEIQIITRTTSMVAVAEGLEVGDEVFVRS